MVRAVLGIDNGVSGGYGYISPSGAPIFFCTPVRTELSYTKTKSKITRVEWSALLGMLDFIVKNATGPIKAFIERPYVNPQGFKATISAVRCLEATLICLERTGIPYEYIDSKQWQKVLLPKGCVGPELKAASMDVGIRMFPMLEKEIRKHKDADALLIAEWARRTGL